MSLRACKKDERIPIKPLKLVTLDATEGERKINFFLLIHVSFEYNLSVLLV